MNVRKSIWIAIVVLLCCSGSSFAQGFPNRPITIVVPFVAGGPIDTLTRILAERMREKLGQPFIIENMGGAAGSLAAGRTAKAPPDGYTMMTAIWGSHVANQTIYKLTYDVQKDFTPIALISNNALLIVGKKDIPATDLNGLIAWLKERDGKASQGNSGVGSIAHVGGGVFQKLTGTKFQFVPYRGLGPAMQDLVAGNIDMIFDTPMTSLPQVKAGTIRAFAITSPKRLAAAPDIPTVDEAGLPGFHVLTWTAFFGPKGMPAEAVTRLNDAVREALADPAVRRRLEEIGQEIYPASMQTPEALAAFQNAELEKWTPILKASGITAD